MKHRLTQQEMSDAFTEYLERRLKLEPGEYTVALAYEILVTAGTATGVEGVTVEMVRKEPSE